MFLNLQLLFFKTILALVIIYKTFCVIYFPKYFYESIITVKSIFKANKLSEAFFIQKHHKVKIKIMLRLQINFLNFKLKTFRISNGIYTRYILNVMVR